MTGRRVEAVVFDVGNVLIQWDPYRMFDELPRSEVTAFFDEIGYFAWNLEQDRGRDWAEAIPELTAHYPHRAALIARLRDDWLRSVTGTVPGMPELLAELAGRGMPLYAITNYARETWAMTTPRFPFLLEHFRDIVVSAHEGVVKPDPRIFRILMARNGLAPGGLVFIDDSPLNVAGARAVGMQALQFSSEPVLRAALRERGVL